MSGRALSMTFAVSLLLHVGARREVERLPAVRPLPMFEAPKLDPPAADLSLYEMSVMEGWHAKPIVITGEEIRSDVTLWRETFFRNWDELPAGVREEGLAAMVARFHRVLGGPATWDRMDAKSWDAVPQPIRAMAVLGMIEHWQRHYRVGGEFGLSSRGVTRRLQAVAMAESWFQHRAASRNSDGSSDLGIGQASAACRSRIRVLYIRGVADFGLSEEDYLDPWKSSRALVFWFSLLLAEAGGDLDVATRAYNVGSDRARSGGGIGYLRAVRRTEAAYLLGSGDSPSWRWLRERTGVSTARASSRRPEHALAES